jgi:glycine dehydrogenase subunit 1
MRYLPNSPAERQAMLQATGHDHIDELFAEISEDLRFKGKLNLPGPLSEAEILECVPVVEKRS